MESSLSGHLELFSKSDLEDSQAFEESLLLDSTREHYPGIIQSQEPIGQGCSLHMSKYSLSSRRPRALGTAGECPFVSERKRAELLDTPGLIVLENPCTTRKCIRTGRGFGQHGLDVSSV